jgi:hypothetical protein
VKRIEQDIAALEQAVQAIAQAFRSTYADYLSTLGQAVRQQLVLASYRLCTQGYPERFLELSLQQRQKLQQALRQLGRQTQTQLIALLEPSDAAAIDPQPQLPEASSPEAEEPEPAEVASEFALDDEASNHEAFDLRFDQLVTPMLLERWQAALEQSITDVLRSTSHAANRLLQQATILPNQLPEPILEAAAKSGMVAEAASGMPNLLNLLVETEEQEESKVTHIIAIRLRLSEIEFGDATLTNCRSKIRSLAARLNQLGRDYQKKQREHAIAEAESAWRSSWYEE